MTAEALEQWRQVVIDGLVAVGACRAAHLEDPQGALAALIEFHAFAASAAQAGNAARIRELEQELNLRTRAHELDKLGLQMMRERNKALESQIAAQKAIIDEVADIYNGSDGVYGWHLNGNPAPWREFDLPDLLHDFYSEEPQR